MKVDINYLKLQQIDLMKLSVLMESPFYIVVIHLLLGLGPSLSAALRPIGLTIKLVVMAEGMMVLLLKLWLMEHLVALCRTSLYCSS